MNVEQIEDALRRQVALAEPTRSNGWRSRRLRDLRPLSSALAPRGPRLQSEGTWRSQSVATRSSAAATARRDGRNARTRRGWVRGARTRGRARDRKDGALGAGRAAAEERGFRILWSRPARSDAQLSLGVFGDLFSTVASGLTFSILGPQRRALDVALLRADPNGLGRGPANSLGRDPRPRSSPRGRVAAPARRRRRAVGRPAASSVSSGSRCAASKAGPSAPSWRPVGGGQDRRPARGRAAGRIGRALPPRTSLVAALHRLFELRLGRSFPRLVVRNIETASGATRSTPSRSGVRSSGVTRT